MMRGERRAFALFHPLRRYIGSTPPKIPLQAQQHVADEVQRPTAQQTHAKDRPVSESKAQAGARQTYSLVNEQRPLAQASFSFILRYTQ